MQKNRNDHRNRKKSETNCVVFYLILAGLTVRRQALDAEDSGSAGGSEHSAGSDGSGVLQQEYQGVSGNLGDTESADKDASDAGVRGSSSVSANYRGRSGAPGGAAHGNAGGAGDDGSARGAVQSGETAEAAAARRLARQLKEAERLAREREEAAAAGAAAERQREAERREAEREEERRRAAAEEEAQRHKEEEAAVAYLARMREGEDEGTACTARAALPGVGRGGGPYWKIPFCSRPPRQLLATKERMAQEQRRRRKVHSNTVTLGEQQQQCVVRGVGRQGEKREKASARRPHLSTAVVNSPPHRGLQFKKQSRSLSGSGYPAHLPGMDAGYSCKVRTSSPSRSS